MNSSETNQNIKKLDSCNRAFYVCESNTKYCTVRCKNTFHIKTLVSKTGWKLKAPTGTVIAFARVQTPSAERRLINSIQFNLSVISNRHINVLIIPYGDI